MPRITTLAVVICLTSLAARADETLLLGFEKDAVAKWAKFEKADDASYSVRRTFAAATGDATQGQWAMVEPLSDKHGFIGPTNKTSYYILQRSGRILNAYGWPGEALVRDWSSGRWLRMDVNTTQALTLRLELEDATIPAPAAWTWKVPAGRWVTLQADLSAGAKMGLDRKHIATFQLIVTETAERIPRGETRELRLDNIRLGNDDDKPKLDVIAGDGPTPLAGSNDGEARVLEPADMTPLASGKASGPVLAVEFKRKQSYPALRGKGRGIGAATPGVVLLLSGQTDLQVSRDGGANWTNLEGKTAAEPTRMTADVRGHRMTAFAEGNEVMAAFIPNHCAGGSGRTELHFYRAVYADGRWTLGGRSVFETGIRHCADHLDLVRTTEGRVWVAWNHLNRMGDYEIRARFSDDDGATWSEPAAGRRVGKTFRGILPGPFLVRDGKRVACVYYSNRRLRVARFDGKAWGEPVDVSDAKPLSVVDGPGGTIWLATADPAGVLRFDGKAWTADNPPGQGSGTLCRAGDSIVCLWKDEADGKSRVLYSVRGAKGWGEPTVAATHDRPIESLAIPRHAPQAFVPIAFDDKTRMAIYATSISTGK